MSVECRLSVRLLFLFLLHSSVVAPSLEPLHSQQAGLREGTIYAKFSGARDSQFHLRKGRKCNEFSPARVLLLPMSSPNGFNHSSLHAVPEENSRVGYATHKQCGNKSYFPLRLSMREDSELGWKRRTATFTHIPSSLSSSYVRKSFFFSLLPS